MILSPLLFFHNKDLLDVAMNEMVENQSKFNMGDLTLPISSFNPSSVPAMRFYS